MGDMGDMFREMSEQKKVNKANRYDQTVAYLNEAGFSYTVPTMGALKFKSGEGKTMMVYPSTSVLVHKSKSFRYRGSKELIAILKREGVNRT